ncbi:MAG: hemerythrin domain-containing protein [Thiohalocapsa sp.]
MSEAITETLIADHRRCNELLTMIETAASCSDWRHIEKEAESFAGAMERHFSFEENILCSTLESASPMAAGLTGLMRKEHMQIRQLLTDLLTATKAGDADECANVIMELHVALEAHNTKEEDILYPLLDRALGAKWTELLSRLAD